MVGAHENRRSGNLILYVVAERVRRAAANDAAVAQDAKIRVERQFAQRHHAFQILQQRQLALQILPASAELLGCRLIIRRSAAHRRGDIRIRQLLAVAARLAVGLRRESGFIQRPIQKIARAVAGKHASGPVAAMRRRRQTNNEHPRPRIAERRNGSPPVVPLPICAPLNLGHVAAVRSQARTSGACHHFIRQNLQRALRHRPVYDTAPRVPAAPLVPRAAALPPVRRWFSTRTPRPDYCVASSACVGNNAARI